MADASRPWNRRAQLCADVYTNPGRTNRDGIEYATSGTGRARTFAICGTNGARDWLYNLAANRITVPGMGRVHVGFFVAMQKTLRDFLTYTNDKPTDLVGHSQGAAVALILAVYVSVMIPDGRKRLGKLCAVAPPRVGDGTFGDVFRTYFDRASCRLYTRDYDLVTKVPRGRGWQHPTETVELHSPIDFRFDHSIDDYIGLIDE